MATLRGNFTKRESGLLVPFRSQPGEDYQGTYGEDAEHLLDIMQRTGINVLHDLPYGPPDQVGCPYSPVSTYAIDSQRIRLEALAQAGDLNSRELDAYYNCVASGEPANTMRTVKQDLLKCASENFINNASPERQQEFNEWRKREAEWLEPYAAYEVLSALPQNAGKRWQDWETGKNYSPDLIRSLQQRFGRDMTAVYYTQWIVEQQTMQYLRYAQALGIEVWTDLPFYVGSQDVWANRNIFELNPDGTQINQGGAPPSATSPIAGQAWGNATYNYHPESDSQNAAAVIEWWTKRLRRANKLSLGKVRLDHFIGFAEPYIIDANAPDGSQGWRAPGMGSALFDRLVQEFGAGMPFYPEDLGTMTEVTPELRDRYGLPSTSLAVRGLTKQLLLGDYETSVNNPDNVDSRHVIFTGNHDSPTLIHALDKIRASNPREFAGYVDLLKQRFPDVRLEYTTPSSELAQLETIRVAQSMGRYSIYAAWDVLGTTSVTQYNTPNTVGGANWAWRMDNGDLGTLEQKLPQLNQKIGDRALLPVA